MSNKIFRDEILFMMHYTSLKARHGRNMFAVNTTKKSNVLHQHIRTHRT